MTNAIHSNGFLHWKINNKSGNLTARFIATHEPEESKRKSTSKGSNSKSKRKISSKKGGTKRVKRHRQRMSKRRSKRHI